MNVDLVCKNRIKYWLTLIQGEQHFSCQLFISVERAPSSTIDIDQRSKDGRSVQVSTLTELKVKSHCTENGKYSFKARDTSWHTAEQIIKPLLRCQQCSDLICDLSLSSHLEERGTEAKLQQRAHQHAERLLRCQWF